MPGTIPYIPFAMKRIQYISRFARPLSQDEVARLGREAEDGNRKQGITGFLVCLGDMFYQLIEGEDAAIDNLFNGHIKKDPRHHDIVCLKAESDVAERLFPEWSMNVFDLNADAEALPQAFRSMVNTLLEAQQILATYTEPNILAIVAGGRDPRTIPPHRVERVLWFSDLVGFSGLTERLPPEETVGLVNEYARICTEAIQAEGGTVTKLTGDGVVAHFPDDRADAALRAAQTVLGELATLRMCAHEDDPARSLHTGIGLTCGPVIEGNMGSTGKKDYTVIGDAVNLAARIEALTRDIGVPILMTGQLKIRTSDSWVFRSMGRHLIRGRTTPVELYSVATPSDREFHGTATAVDRLHSGHAPERE